MFIYKNKINYVHSCLKPNKKTLHPLLKDYDDLKKPYKQHVYDNLEIFKDYDSTETKTLISSINKTKTSGHIKLQNMLMNIQNHSYLQKNYKLSLANYDKIINKMINELATDEESLLIYCDVMIIMKLWIM